MGVFPESHVWLPEGKPDSMAIFFSVWFFWAIHQPIPSDHTLQRFSLRTLPLCPPEFFRQLVPCSVASSAAKLILPFVCHCNMPHCIFMCRHITYNIYIYMYLSLSLSPSRRVIICLSLSLYTYGYKYPFIYIYIYLSIYLSLSLSIYLSLSHRYIQWYMYMHMCIYVYTDR